ncbi:hypothetical protein NUH88_05400 [Nisaea acidiphila]|uniref:Uncharacterized protein n=1 Tax=Nisaea acidiphila TaxID=1862145 RepID=A0A9J7B0B1_9PROT|nr:hypothetical protein [Nisaea acidiphila]UUX51125.1 hypothetical protein NUH88_05400 [Nisaea acidiphila]
MFSLQKILVLFAVLAAVWYGFKLVTRLDQARKQKLKEEAKSGGASASPGSSKPEDGVVDLVQNPDGTYGAKKKDRSA